MNNPITSSSVRADHPVGPQTDRRRLAAGAAAGVVYLGVGAVQALFRPGFDVSRHAGSMLTLGDYGWIQTVNFVVTGLLLIAGAIGLGSVLAASPHGTAGAKWSARLLGIYGASFVLAGIFVPDPAQGFPPGAPAGPGPISWHGLAHFVAGGIGFLCFIAACFVLARRFSRNGLRGWAAWSRITGVLFLAAFLGIASGSAGPTVLAFVGAVLLSFGWLTAVFLKFRRDNR